MHESLIQLFVDNYRYICIPFGLFFPYIVKFIESFRKEKPDYKEELITKSYEHLLELYERSDSALEERTQVLLKNILLKKENKDIKGVNASLNIIITDLKQQIKDLKDKLKNEKHTD